MKTMVDHDVSISGRLPTYYYGNHHGVGVIRKSSAVLSLVASIYIQYKLLISGI